MEKDTLLGTVYVERGYEKEEMGRRIVKETVYVLYPKAFCALMVTCRLVTDCEDDPEMTPVVVFRVNPTGRVPDVIEMATDSPVNDGEAEKGTPLVR